MDDSFTASLSTVTASPNLTVLHESGSEEDILELNAAAFQKPSTIVSTSVQDQGSVWVRELDVYGETNYLIRRVSGEGVWSVDSIDPSVSSTPRVRIVGIRPTEMVSMENLWDHRDFATPERRRILIEILYWESRLTGDDKMRWKCVQCVQKVSRHAGVLPADLHVLGIIRKDDHPVSGGGFADIYRGRKDDQEVCLKVLRIFTSQSTAKKIQIVKDFSQEALIWNQLHHKNVIPFLGVSVDLVPGSFCLISPWMKNGNVMNYLEGNLTCDKMTLVVDIACGLKYLHEQVRPVVHGDLKGVNVLVTNEGVCCLADFGLSAVVAQSQPISNDSGPIRGSIRWMAPELLNDHDPLTRTSKASDVYALGCIILEMYTGKAPFMDTYNDMAVFINVRQRNRPTRPAAISDSVLWSLIQTCWAHDPDERPTMSSVLETLEAPRAVESSGVRGVMSPPPLFLQGITAEHFPATSSDVADVYKGSLGQQKICIKVLRVFSAGDLKDTLVKARITREAVIWTSLRHSNIVPMLGLSLGAFPNNISLITPWFPYGNTLKYLKEYPTVDVTNMVSEIIGGLAYLHERSIVHGNLKAANVLVGSGGICSLTDIGLSEVLKTSNYGFADSGSRFVSTRWTSPELIQFDSGNYDSPSTQAADIYALACTILELYTRHPPFFEIKHEIAVVMKVLSGERPQRPENLRIQNEIWSLVEQCWAQAPEARPSISLVQSITTTALKAKDMMSEDGRDSTPGSTPTLAARKRSLRFFVKEGREDRGSEREQKAIRIPSVASSI